MGYRGSLLLVLLAGAATAREGRAQLTGNQVYKAIEPCRIVDTRIATPPVPLAANAPRAFDVVGGASLVAQGGSASGCGIPGYGGSPTPSHPRVQAVMMNFIAVGPAGAGNLRAWASGPAPNASVLNYGAGTTVANGVVVPLAQDATPGADLQVQADVAATHLVIDVLGYFSERHPLAGEGRPGVAVVSTSPNPEIFELCTGPTGISFSLSNTLAHAAESPAACEAGFWVCSGAERGVAPCDTQVPDDACDALGCDGACQNYAANNHEGWLADRPDTAYFAVVTEAGQAHSTVHCFLMPVWCCTY